MAEEREVHPPEDRREETASSPGRSTGLRRGTYLNLFGGINLLAMVVFGLYHLLGPEWEVKPILGIVELAFGGLTLGLLLFLRLTQNLRLAVNMGLCLTIALLATLLFSGGVAGTGLFWWFCLPAAAFYLKGSRGGWAWVGASLVLLGGRTDSRRRDSSSFPTPRRSSGRVW